MLHLVQDLAALDWLLHQFGVHTRDKVKTSAPGKKPAGGPKQRNSVAHEDALGPVLRYRAEASSQNLRRAASSIALARPPLTR